MIGYHQSFYKPSSIPSLTNDLGLPSEDFFPKNHPSSVFGYPHGNLHVALLHHWPTRPWQRAGAHPSTRANVDRATAMARRCEGKSACPVRCQRVENLPSLIVEYVYIYIYTYIDIYWYIYIYWYIIVHGISGLTLWPMSVDKKLTLESSISQKFVRIYNRVDESDVLKSAIIIKR